MPHIRIRALRDSDVKQLSQVLPGELSQIMNTPEDNFTVEKLPTVFYRAGVVVPDGEGDPMIEIHWFDRGPEVKSTVAKRVTDLVRTCSKSEYIAVVFFDLPKSNYFENGIHF
ncbi:DUF1904 domain-containing protein [Bdellovibrio sp. qaytius]|nr:DUF1904 domain-containing protein [Bdellovibrio sp. qaytius]